MAQVMVEEQIHFEIPNGVAKEYLTYSKDQLFPSESIDRQKVVREAFFRGKNGPFTVMVLHYGGTLPVLHSSSQQTDLKILPEWQRVSFSLPATTPQIEQIRKRIRQVEESNDEEFYFDEGVLKIRNLYKVDDEDLVSTEELDKIGKPQEEKGILDEVISNDLARLEEDVSKSKMQKEGTRLLQMLSNDIVELKELIKYCAVPPASTANPLKNDQITEWIDAFVNFGCINVAQMLVNYIVALAKYTKYDEDFFGITNDDLGITLGNTRKTMEMMKNLKGISRVTLGLDSLVKGIAIILPAEEELIQRKIMGPALPSGAMRTTQQMLTE